MSIGFAQHAIRGFITILIDGGQGFVIVGLGLGRLIDSRLEMDMKTKSAKRPFIFFNRHSQRLSEPLYYQRWLLKNATAQNLRNGNRPQVTLPKLAFMERPEIYPDL